MNRRMLIKSGMGGIVLASAETTGGVAAQSTPVPTPLQVRSEWNTDGETDSGLESFTTVITAYPSGDKAEDAFKELFEGVQQGALYNQDTGNETFGDESFFVEYNNMGGLFVIYEGTIRIDKLIYQFRWEAVHYGGARDGHRLFEAVIERAVIEDSNSEEELSALLPTEEEVAEYGLTELEQN